jgi:hypothetical protein
MKKHKSFLIALFVMMTVTNFAYAAPYGGSENSGGGVFVNGGGQGFSWANIFPQIVKIPGQVLGTSTTASTATSTSCSYMIPRQVLGVGLKNDPEQVKLLQKFLNKEMGSRLVVNGNYNIYTKYYAQQFQKKYKNDVLTPWNLTGPTTYTYYTTIAKINSIMCPEEKVQIEQDKLIAVPLFKRLFGI